MRIVGFIIAAAAILIPFPPADKSSDSFLSSISDSAYIEGLNECTTGLALGAATPDGRPLLWKNRDIGNRRQEFHYYNDGRIPFISITYAGETDEYYGGVNAEGFALENSNSYNLGGGPYRNGFVDGGDDDGFIHTLALSTCRTVDDFQRILDSTNYEGRTLNSNYGAIDAYGNAAMFETGGYEYTRCDAAEAPGGFLVRSNYSYSGNVGVVRASSWGPHRHDAAQALFRAAVEEGKLSPQYLFQRVIRDLSLDGLDPYPLPFDGYYGDYAYGCIPNSDAICRSTTQGVLVVQGVAAGGDPNEAILWAMAGSQLTSVTTPLWVRAGEVPIEYDGPVTARLNTVAAGLETYVYQRGGFGTSVNTWKLTNPEGNGLWDYTLPLERWVFQKTQQFLQSPGFRYDRLAAFQREMAQQIADSLEAWKPSDIQTEVALAINNRGFILRWDPDGAGLAGARRYRVFGSDEPFREGARGAQVCETNDTSWEIGYPGRTNAFYRVEAIY